MISDLNRLPHAIAISETKLKEENTTNVNIPGYRFFRYDSPTHAGGVGLYLEETLQYRVRNDFLLEANKCEDLWIEIESKQANKSLIVAVVYRHPNKSILSFQNKLFDTLMKLENQRITYIISGDININLNLKSDNIRNYVDFMSSIGCKSMIRNPTRFSDNGKASLLDHIYTNSPKLKIKAGVCLYDISDHLPTFFILKNTNLSTERVTKLKRCMKNFILENFIFELNSQLSRIDFDSAHIRT